MTSDTSSSYRDAGVDTAAGDRAVELMKAAVTATHGPNVFGGVGGFAGLFDVSFLKQFQRPLLATSTDGVGTKVAIAQALDKHDTIGQDLVGMVVDDIVVVGARPMFMTDYIACGRVIPSRIADIVAGIAHACSQTGTALVGGETAEHPGLLGPDDYDVAGAAVGAVEAGEQLGAHRVEDGDVVIALESSGLHSNGFSLVRSILRGASIDFVDRSDDFGGVVGEVLLEPTRLYTAPLLRLPSDGTLHALSHVTGGGIAANLARVLPRGSWVEIERSSWSPPAVFRVLSELGGSTLQSAEGTWNLGIGMLAVVASESAGRIIGLLTSDGVPAWEVGRVSTGTRGMAGFDSATSLPGSPAASFESTPDSWVQGAKGVDGGAVRLVGAFAD